MVGCKMNGDEDICTTGRGGESSSSSVGVDAIQHKHRPRLMSFEEAVAGETMARCLADMTNRNKQQQLSLALGRPQMTHMFGRSLSYNPGFSDARYQRRRRPCTPSLGSGQRMLTINPALDRGSNSQECVNDRRIFRQTSEPAMLTYLGNAGRIQNLNRSRSNNTGFSAEPVNVGVSVSCNSINKQRHSSPHPNRRSASSRCMSYSERTNEINDNVRDSNALQHAHSEPKLRDSPRLIVVDIPLESEAGSSLDSGHTVQGNNSNTTKINHTEPDGKAFNDNCNKLIAGPDLKVTRSLSFDDSTNYSTSKPEVEEIWTRRVNFNPEYGVNSSKVSEMGLPKTKCNFSSAVVTQSHQQDAIQDDSGIENAPLGGQMELSRDNSICSAESGMNGMYHDEGEVGESCAYELMEHTTDSETCDSSSVDSRNEMTCERGSSFTGRSRTMECHSAPLLRKQVSFDLSLTFFDDEIANGHPTQGNDAGTKSSPWFKRLRLPTRSRSEGRMDTCTLDDVFEEHEEPRKSGTLPRNIGSSLFREDLTEVDNSQSKFSGGKSKSSTLPASYRALPHAKSSIMQPDFFVRRSEKYPKPRKKDHGKVSIPKQRAHSDNNPYSCHKREKRSSIIMEEEDLEATTAPSNKRPFSGLRRMLSRESVGVKAEKSLRRRSKSESAMLLPLGDCKVCGFKVERGDEVAMPTADIIHKSCFKCAK
ncbi:uncharacterized protein [Diadema antillarum]|uniref:uncharacterized protein n=1 Tax=Diadema antillarum TaxID=105358 RepID=UPI003A8A61DF